MNWEEMCKLDDRLTAILQEAGAYRVLSEDGKPIRTFSAERAAKLRKDPNFCRVQLWRGLPGKRGDVGLLDQLQQVVGWGAQHPELRNSDAYDIAYHRVFNAEPLCQHDDDNCKWDYSTAEVQPCPSCGSAVLGTDVRESKEMTAWTCQCGTRRESLKRKQDTGWGSIIDRLAHAAATLQAEEEGTPPPAPLVLIDENTKFPDDSGEPVFIVKNEDDGWRLRNDLKLRERLQAGEIGRSYARDCIYLCDKKARKILLAAKLTKHNITGGLSWRPVVLTFKDAELERKLSSVCVQVLTIEGKREKGDDLNVIGHYDPEEIRQAVKAIAPAVQIGFADMPADVLDGWLGDAYREHMTGLPIAYAWPALLTAASVLLPKMGKIRGNLFTGLIGPVGSGKTSAFELAFWLLNVNSPTLMKLKAGSSEGMSELIGDVGGVPRLVFVNELAHMLAKVNYEGSTFEQFLNDAYYEDYQELTVARRKHIVFNARLTLAGGLPENKFEDLFGVGTAGGFHDRMLFGVYPTKFKPYPWRPLEGISPLLPELSSAQSDDVGDESFGEPLIRSVRPQPITIEPDVWAERSRWQNEFGIGGRASESGIRAAIICATFDCRGTLRVADLGPALAFARYQEEVHKRFEPNPGKTNEAIVARKILNYLQQHEPNGEKYVNRREMFNTINAYDFGPSVATRGMQALEASGEIEQIKSGRQWLVRLNPKGENN
jgi:hypothetical protein